VRFGPSDRAIGGLLIESGDDDLTTDKPWPWPNEGRIKAQMCATTTRGFWAASSLSEYMCGALGSAPPVGF